MTTHFKPANTAVQEVKPWGLEKETKPLPLFYPNPEYAVIMVMAGDDEVLGPYVSRDINQMGKGVCGGKEVSVLALVDGFTKGETKLLEITNGEICELGTLAGVDTGDPRPLAEFLTLALSSYSAETKIALGFWGHGEGVFGDIDPYENLIPDALLEMPLGTKLTETMFLENYLAEPTPFKPFVSKAMLPDATSGGVLTNRELNSALAVAFSRSGRTEPVEMIFFDTCLNGSAEVYTELRRYARCFAGSSLSMPGSGWNYTWFLQMTRRYKPKDAKAWGKMAIDAFDRTYDQSLFPFPAHLVAMSTEGNFVPKLREVVERIQELGNGAELVGKTLGVLEAVGEDESVDLYSMVKAIRAASGDEDLRTRCSEFLDAYERDLIAMSKDPGDGQVLAGLTVWLPRLGDNRKVESYYRSLMFHKETGWLDVVEPLLQKKVVEKPKAFVVLSVLGLKLKKERQIRETEITTEADGGQTLLLHIPQGSEMLAGSLCEGEYEFAGVNNVALSSRKDILKFVEVAESLRRRDDEFSALSAVRDGDVVLGPESALKFARDLDKYEGIVYDEYPGLAKVYFLVKKLAVQAAKSSGVLLLGEE